MANPLDTYLGKTQNSTSRYDNYPTEKTYDKIASQGRFGDTELAHVNMEEKNLLKELGGSGTTNPKTGLKEYFRPGKTWTYEDETNRDMPAQDTFNYDRQYYDPLADEYYTLSDREGFSKTWGDDSFEYLRHGMRDPDEFIDLFITEDNVDPYGHDGNDGLKQLIEEYVGTDYLVDAGKYMPLWDFEAAKRRRDQVSSEMSSLGEKKQDDLLNIAIKKDKLVGARDFASSGSPVLDRAETAVLNDSKNAQDEMWDKFQEGEYVKKEDFIEDWILAIEDWMDGELEFGMSIQNVS